MTGTDLSPMQVSTTGREGEAAPDIRHQPTWVPPNVKFELDDASKSWTWDDKAFDFIHIRYLNGAFKDWPAVFREAYRCCQPGGWIESCEFDPKFQCDDGSLEGNKVAMDAVKGWNSCFEEGGQKLGLNFIVARDGTQDHAITGAGFEDLNIVTYKASVGSV